MRPHLPLYLYSHLLLLCYPSFSAYPPALNILSITNISSITLIQPRLVIDKQKKSHKKETAQNGPPSPFATTKHNHIAQPRRLTLRPQTTRALRHNPTDPTHNLRDLPTQNTPNTLRPTDRNPRPNNLLLPRQHKLQHSLHQPIKTINTDLRNRPLNRLRAPKILRDLIPSKPAPHKPASERSSLCADLARDGVYTQSVQHRRVVFFEICAQSAATSGAETDQVDAVHAFC